MSYGRMETLRCNGGRAGSIECPFRQGRAWGAEGGDYGNGVLWEEVSKEQRNALESCKLQLRAKIPALFSQKTRQA